MNSNTKTHNCRCYICLKSMYVQPYRLRATKRIMCSRQCTSINKSLGRIKEIEKQAEIDNLYDLIKSEYENNMKSIRQISEIVYGSNKYATSISSYMDLFGIRKRRGSEAVKTQWIDNDKRRKEQAIRTSEILGAGTPAREKMKLTMRTKESRERQSLAKRGSKNPMYGITGKNHPNWNPERTHDKRVKERKLFLDREWRLSVFERDSYICQCCGYDKGGILVAHHLNGYHWDTENRYNADNGVTLCEPCHLDFHNKYGYMNNTKEQFKEYMKIQQLTLL